eukprot:1948956-Rhodomonas_salina.9
METRSLISRTPCSPPGNIMRNVSAGRRGIEPEGFYIPRFPLSSSPRGPACLECAPCRLVLPEPDVSTCVSNHDTSTPEHAILVRASSCASTRFR